MRFPKWETAEQGSDQWLAARRGVLTASRMAEAMDFLKSGKESEKRLQLKFDLMAERMTGFAVDHFVTPAMRHGIENEPFAREQYEVLTGELVDLCGLALHGEIPFFGASPDGLLGMDGLIEIKCPSTKKFIQWTMAGCVVPDEHKPQMLAQLACTGRKWVDFVAYDPRVPAPKNIFIARFEPTEEEIAAVEDAARQFLAELEEMWDVFFGVV